MRGSFLTFIAQYGVVLAAIMVGGSWLITNRKRGLGFNVVGLFLFGIAVYMRLDYSKHLLAPSLKLLGELLGYVLTIALLLVYFQNDDD